MGRGLAGAGEVVGGFCAAFLAFIAVGGAVALLIAAPYNVDQNCWPHLTLLGIVRTECADPLADAAWYVGIEVPRYLVVMPTLALAQLVEVIRTQSTYWLSDVFLWGRWGVLVLIAALVGYVHLRARMQIVAWVLLALLAGQIAFGVAPHLMPEQVEPM